MGKKVSTGTVIREYLKRGIHVMPPRHVQAKLARKAAFINFLGIAMLVSGAFGYEHFYGFENVIPPNYVASAKRAVLPTYYSVLAQLGIHPGASASGQRRMNRPMQQPMYAQAQTQKEYAGNQQVRAQAYEPQSQTHGRHHRGRALRRSLASRSHFEYVRENPDSQVSSFFAALKTGDMNGMRTLLNSGWVHVDKARYKGFTPLEMAVWQGNVKAVKFLLEEQKANPNIRDAYGTNALYYANQRKQRAIARILVRAGAKPDILVGER